MARPRGPENLIKSVRYLARRIAEDTLGRALPAGAVVHHFDENPTNNAKSNLIICPTEAYHNLLHVRTHALEEGGNPEFRKCQYCGSWGWPEEMACVRKSDRASLTYYHHACRRIWRKRARDEGKNV